ncbi:glucose-6-phosphate isomerase [Salinisphaera orenii]|uniref:Glucose-6-phosphate isomerase n=1 Tax=Salinisphaera orenii YIM 95161 TaxID=1051139 RepID=A0A423QAC6_9GAMM|nr:glucose-6-phosphate isomerase [Salinisphaera halophila]ROO37482.1 glucose-6-phosphate isomerase [Salinisphaera halophila YIM 95161]
MTDLDIRQQPAWRDLGRLAAQMSRARVDSMFAHDPARAERFTLSAAGITLDYSKQRVDQAVMRALGRLAETQGFHAARTALFSGAPVNNSEGRAAWHMALRRPDDAPLHDEVHAVRAAMAEFVDDVRRGRWLGYTGAPISDVVNIGIGGSDLGPRLICDALAQLRQRIHCHFVANVDPADLDDTLIRMDPERTLFIVTSKSFGTAETLANAQVARQWLLDNGASEDDIARHFVAVSTNEEAVRAFGIERMFGFWDWVGGRFSLWSAVGISIALGLGMETFDALLAGAHAMDNHFETAPLETNLPATLALVGVWNNNFLGLPSHVVVPYAQRLAAMPAFLQQLEMESNGKSVTRDGEAVRVETVPTVWGSVGTNAQHAFFQMLHQGVLAADVDFVLPLSDAEAAADDRERQRVANCLAQAEALMRGRDTDALVDELTREGLSGWALEQRLAARRFDGNRPNSMILMDRLDAWHLGALVAAYEHKVFVQGVIWNINSFDQWGVELGKTMAGQLLGELEGSREPADHDASTDALMARVRRAWGRAGG